jgi:hypothetical protein
VSEVENTAARGKKRNFIETKEAEQEVARCDEIKMLFGGESEREEEPSAINKTNLN